MPCDNTMRAFTSACFRTRPPAVVAALAVIAVFSGFSGCAATSFQTARTLDKGKSKFYVAPSAMRISVGGKPTVMPFIEVGSRYGISDNIEIGGHIGAGLGADVKIALARPATPTAGWDVSIAPGIGYIGGFSGTPTGGDSMHFFGATIPLMLTRHFGDKLSVTVGPRLMYLMSAVAAEGAQTTHIYSVGSSFAVSIKLTDALRVVPGFAFALPFRRTLSEFGSDNGVGDQRLFQFGVGFVFGG